MALKLIAPELAEDKRFRERFLREPRLAASLDHPNVIPIYEAGERDGQLYLAMRYVEGSDLKTLLRREGKLQPERTLAILAQVAAALDAAHRRALVHRDVKPANILLDEGGHVYLTDFGITKQLGGDSTDTGRVVGTLDYLAPEQIRGDPVDGRTDCYSLACVLYECLSGTPPFHRDTEAETMWAHMQEQPAPVRRYPKLDAVLCKALAKEREERHGSCVELTGAASDALGLVAPRHPTFAPPALVRRRHAIFAAGLLLLAASITAGVLALTDDDAPSTAPRAALDVDTDQVAALDAGTGDLKLAAPLPGRPTDVAIGGGLTWVATVDSTTVTGVSPRSRSVSRTIPLRGRADAIAVGGGSVWVADGARGVLSRVDAGSQRVAQRIRFPRARSTARLPGRLRGPRASLATGGGAVWLTNGSDRLMRVDLQTGRVTSKPAGLRVDDVAVGAGAVWAMGSRSAAVVRVDPRSGTATGVVRIAATRGADAPVPVAIAATRANVWVLNGNTATVTRIDPRALGVAATVPVGVERVPEDIAAARATAWVANGDGSLSRIDAGAPEPEMIEVGEALEKVAVDRATVWVTTTSFDQKLPGGGE